MTLQRITVAGYKAYPQTVEINLKPITLLYGENSTGKSTLMRVLPLIRETIKNPSRSPLTLSQALTKSANLADLFSAYRNDGVIDLDLQFKDNEGHPIIVGYKFKRLERGDVVLLEFSFSAQKDALKIELDLNTINSATVAAVRYVDFQSKQEVSDIWFDGIVPRTQEAGTELAKTVEIVTKLLYGIQCYWLAPLRSAVPRISRLGKNISEVGAFGEGCVDILYEDSMANGPVFRDVSDWFEKNCSAALQIVPGAHEFGALAGLALVRQGKTPVRIPLEDCGEGITQVLPVLVLVALAKHGRLGQDPVVVLEHPDLHLHSNAHYDIIRTIIGATKTKYKPRFLLESHAESILTATQLHVVSGELLPRHVLAIHVTETDQGSSAIDIVEFESNGSTKGNFAAIDWFDRTNARALKLAKKMVGLP